MLRIATRQLTRPGVVLAVGGGAAAYSLANSDASLGLRRQTQFWTRILPIVADYYWNYGSSSPYTRYQKYIYNQDEYNEQRSRLLAECHERHAPEMLNVMLELKGLYIKLGQVLSVTALPIPEAYRERFRTLQSDVPGFEDVHVVRQVLRDELGRDDVFSYIDPVPCGAASIGQANLATLRETGEQVIVKMQYPDASWQVPADIQCVGDFLKLCVWAGVVDESAANLSYKEFANQFLSELDYQREQDNLQTTYESSLLPNSPYQQRGVVVPKVYPEYSTAKVVTMTYIRGPKLEEEARRQLELLGIDTKRSIGSIVREAAKDAAVKGDEMKEDDIASEATMGAPRSSWKARLIKRVSQIVGVDNSLWAVRQARRGLLWSTAAVATTVGWASPILPKSWNEWSKIHVAGYQQAQRLALTQSWIDALFDVHGYQIFQVGLFNADCHPGNILVVEEDDGSPATRLGLIDFGQCKQLSPDEQVRIARLVLSVANKESDQVVAAAFRDLGVQTKNDSTEFLAEMAHLMFGSFKTQHLDHAYHKKLHNMDRITYFPNELSMVYRTCLLLRGLAISLQVNPSVSEHWKSHAQAAIEEHGGALDALSSMQEVETNRQVKRRDTRIQIDLQADNVIRRPTITPPR
jgi:aarF domain-containing kinase